MTNFNWTEEQIRVIQSPSESRLLVDAGPGTGKTATACARVAWLIEEAGLEPHQILMTSFTNAAIHEITSRIGSFLENPEKALGIRVSTLDSFSWNLRYGFHRAELELRGFTENIQQASDLIEVDSNVQEYLQSIEHFIVDEAQDITGYRSQLILNILKNLKNTSGISIFSDEAQAIYGFSEDDKEQFFGNTLPQEIRSSVDVSRMFTSLNLTEVHRTKDDKLRTLFKEGRRKLLQDNDSPVDQIYDQVRDLVVSTYHQQIGTAYEMIVTNPSQYSINDGDFMLFRRRSEALQTCHYFSTQQYRLRLSGFPVAIEPWIARCFWDWSSDKITQTEFEELYAKRIHPEDNLEIQLKWKDLLREVGTESNRISLKKLSNLLSRPNVPRCFAKTDYGISGPIIGTIHAAKGRESDRVLFFVPKELNFQRLAEEGESAAEKVLEEARILFVGSTRAKDTLVISDSKSGNYFRRSGNLSNLDRAYTVKKKEQNKIAVEIGRKGDIAPENLVGKSTFMQVADAQNAQEAIWLRRDVSTPLKAEAFSQNNYNFQVIIDYDFANKNYEDSLAGERYEKKLCNLSQTLNADFFTIGREELGGSLRPPTRFRHFYSIGARTVSVATDDPVRELLLEPWNHSGFMLAPMIVGYPDVYLIRYKGGKS